MPAEDVLRLSDLNLAAYIREMTRWNASGEIFEQDDLLLTKGPGTSPVTSVAMSLYNRDDPAAINRFDRIRSFYRERKSSFSIHIRKHADAPLEAICLREKMIRISDAPGMMTDHPLKDITASEGIEIRHVINVDGVMDFAAVTTQSYRSLGMPVQTGQQIFASPERLLQPHNYLVVAYDQEQPVSAAMILFSHSIAGIYWVGTVEHYRGRGLAHTCVCQVTHEAFRRGAPLVVLQASKFGEPLYKRMGFKEFTKYPWYMYFEK
jgi:ribosomal protein S18 acetylase RimI-like enzyme